MSVNVIPEAIGIYMRASQSLRRDLGKLQHQLEIQTKRVENLKKSLAVYECDSRWSHGRKPLS